MIAKPASIMVDRSASDIISANTIKGFESGTKVWHRSHFSLKHKLKV